MIANEILIFDKKGNKRDKLLAQLQFSRPVYLDEFHCHCKSELCTRTLIKSDIPNKVAIIKKLSSTNVIITSAFRCQLHNNKVGGKDTSYHLIGHAVDIFPEDGDVDALFELMDLYFDVVIKYDTFVHGHDFNEEKV